MDYKQNCPGCQKPLPPDVPLGLCPECLIQAGFKTGTETGGENRGFVPPPVEQIKQLFPQLEIIGLIGRGGMGAVYQARQPALDRLVALKILPPSMAGTPGFGERFTREARALARLVHPNIVAVHDFGQAGELNYFIMEYVDGANLREVERAGRLTAEQALAIVPQICEALQFAHNEGIVHRDIKPENILMDKKGRIKITDFGIAKILGQNSGKSPLTGAKDIVGTPHYMAPEQIETPNLVDHRADIYSLGVVFYEMLTGELPLGRFAAPSSKARVDVRLDDVVLQALEKEPGRRHQQASQVKTEVETIAGTKAQFAQPPPLAATAVISSSGAGKITAPAVALMIAALWNILPAISGLIAVRGGTQWLDSFQGYEHFFSQLRSPFTILCIVFFKMFPGLLILFGGYQMLQLRSYAWAIAAGILAIVACSLIGFPVGIWALIVLSHDDVKRAFGRQVAAAPAPVAPQPDHFWRRFAIVAACILSIPVVIVILAISASLFVHNGSLDFFGSHASAGGYPQATHAATNESGQPGHPPSLAYQWTFNGSPLVDPTNGPGLLPNGSGIRQESGEFREDIAQTFPLNAGGNFKLDNINGRVDIHGWSSNFVAVKAFIHGKTRESVEGIKIKIISDPEAAAIHTEQPSVANGGWSWFFSHNEPAEVDYTVQVPQYSRLANISSVNGSIGIDGDSNDINASTVNGAMHIKDVAGNLTLSTVNGQIVAEMSLLKKGQAVSLETVNGAIKLSLPADAGAHFSADTLNGRITSDFASLNPKKEFPVGQDLNGSLGDGGATVKASTVNGTIKFLKGQAVKGPATIKPIE